MPSLYGASYRRKLATAMLFSYLPTMIMMKQTKIITSMMWCCYSATV